jgi:hypothetical protein
MAGETFKPVSQLFSICIHLSVVITKNLNVSSGSSSYVWKVLNFADGNYKIRIVGDGKETFIPPAQALERQQPCFEDGEAMPGVSASFRIVNPKDIRAYVDRFPPNSQSFQSYSAVDALLYLAFLAFFFL